MSHTMCVYIYVTGKKGAAPAEQNRWSAQDEEEDAVEEDINEVGTRLRFLCTARCSDRVPSRRLNRQWSGQQVICCARGRMFTPIRTPILTSVYAYSDAYSDVCSRLF
jgi:hypothetical protein